VADFRNLNDTLRKHCGHDAPPYSLILETLEEILRTVRFLAKDKLAAGEEETTAMAEAPSASDAAPSTTAARTGNSGPIGSREDALRRLEEIARFFRATEPHTPL